MRIGVSDNGTGAPKDKQKELFKPFARLDAEVTAIEGTDIELTLTKQIVELMTGVSASRARRGKAVRSGST